MGTLLEVKNLKTHFVTRSGVVRAVDDVSWDVGESETVAPVSYTHLTLPTIYSV